MALPSERMMALAQEAQEKRAKVIGAMDKVLRSARNISERSGCSLDVTMLAIDDLRHMGVAEMKGVEIRGGAGGTEVKYRLT
ncbi:MAG: hypothetical protein M0Z66_16050 [Thermaerobacter sp.]|nr:hypothetical protein [Thermaerobacter sp.]